MLSRDNIKKAIADGEIKIYPFEEKNLTGIGYNLSTTNFAFSLNKGVLLTIHHQTTRAGVKRYVMLPANDTVLFFSKEYIEINNNYAGTFHSKVGRVCQGIGRISTTLDPTWKGQLIISVDNPNSKDICFDLDKDSGNIMTLLLHKLDSPVSEPNIHDNNKGRCDLLLEHFSKPYTNKKYQDKHLELKGFITGEFADSLNGFDSFIDSDSINDRYTQKIQQLLELRDRYEKESRIIKEGRYVLGEYGRYFLFKNASEAVLLAGCSLAQMKGLPNVAKLLEEEKKGISKDDLSSAVPKIETYLSIICYELETIDHVRRIEWQNRKIEHFSSEDSELVALRHKEEKKKQLIWFWMPTLLLCIGAIYLVFWTFNQEATVFATIIAGAIPFVVEQWYTNWRKIRDLRGNKK